MTLGFHLRPSIRLVGKAYPAITLTLICTLVLPTLFFYPFYSDIDVHHCIALEVIRSSNLPYRASFVANLPGIVGVHLLGIMLFGTSVPGFRLLEIIVHAAIVLVLYRVSRLWLPAVPALVGSSMYALTYVHGPGFYVGHPDCFAVLPIVGGIGLLTLAFRCHAGVVRTTLLVGSGIAYGAATCFRPTFALLLFLPVLYLFNPRTGSGRRDCALTILGFTIMIAGCVASYAPTLQGVKELYISIIQYNIEVYAHAFQWENCSKRSLVVVALIGGWYALVFLRSRTGQSFENAPKNVKERRFLIVTEVSLLIEIGSMGGLAGYHLTPFFALFLPVIATTFWEWSREQRWRKVCFRLLLTGTIVYLYPWQQINQMFLSGSNIPPFSKEWYSDGITTQVVSYVLDRTKPTDAVEASCCPAVRWRIHRPTATRFNIPQCITLTLPGGGFTLYQKKWQSEYVRSIEQIRPKYYLLQDLVDSSGANSILGVMFTIPGLHRLLDRYYRLDTVIANYLFYLRRDPT